MSLNKKDKATWEVGDISSPEISFDGQNRTGSRLPRGKISQLIILISMNVFALFTFWYLDSSRKEVIFSGSNFSKLSLAFSANSSKGNDQERPGYTLMTGEKYTKSFQNNFRKEKRPPLLIMEESFIETLEISCIAYDIDHLNIVIRDAEKRRYEMPHEYPYPHARNPQNISIEESNFQAFVKYDPFDIIITRKTTQEVLFNFTDRFIYTDLYLEFSFYTPTNHIYGFGERLRNLQFTPGIYTLYMLDRSGEIDKGKSGFNQQGHHSMYMMRENSGKYHVNLLRNTNAQEVVLTKENKVTWKMIGGVIDLNFFLGESPEEASMKYHRYLGGWALPALWHLGHHQSKFGGYMNASHMEQILEGFEDKNLPLDALWSDLDFALKRENFRLDENRFPPKHMNELFKAHRKRWIPIVDPWIPFENELVLEERERVMNITMNNTLGEVCTGESLAGETYFIDYLNPKSEEIWTQLLDGLNEKWTFSGIWLDANEITNYIVKGLAYYRKRKYFALPFYPGLDNLYNKRIVNLDCKHYGDVDEYNIRSLSSLLQSKYTYNHLKKRFPFPFILSRATMFGGGQFAYTWVPDVHSNWESIIPSLGTTLSFALFGIPMVGTDICGFTGTVKTAEDLCARWYQLAVFYPFARNSHAPITKNHNNFQEPYTYTGQYLNTITQAVKLRYSILKYILAIFFSKKDSSIEEVRGVGTIMRPLFFGFHDDPTLPVYGDRAHDEQFLLGDAIMAAPVLYKNSTNVTVYFPNCRWFDVRTLKEIQTRGGNEIVSAEFNEDVPYFLRGGHILFKQDATDVSNSDDLSNIFTLIIGLNDLDRGKKISKASGQILGTKSYEENYIYKKCVVEGDCVLDVFGTYEKLKDEIHFTLEVAPRYRKASFDGIKINEIYILGAFVGDHEKISKVKLKNNQKIRIHMIKFENGKVIKLNFPVLELGEQSKSKYTFIIN